MKYKDFIIFLIIIFFFLGVSLIFHTKYTEITYKYNKELKKYIVLNKNLKKTKIEIKILSAPKRIMNYANKNIGLHLPKLNEVFEIEK